MPITLNGTTGITTPGVTNSGSETVTNTSTVGALTVNGNNISAVNSLGFRNRIINGGMQIDQRNAGASQTPTADDTYNVDRWAAGINVASKFSMQQNTADAPTTQGFSYCVKITSLSAYSVAAGDVAVYKQTIEGFNVADLAWGTASAKTVTLSFWVRSSITGTFGGTLMNSAQNRAYPFTYTINSANTWEYETITIPGDTTGTWLTTNGAGIKLGFQLGVGSTFTGTAGSWSANNYWGATGATNMIATNGATFYITGVQLEAGSVATPFEARDYGRELIMCQRYYIQITGNASNPAIGTGTQVTTTQAYGVVPLPVSMRSTSPTLTGGVAVTDTFSYNTGMTTTGGVVSSNSLALSGTMSAVGAQGRPIVFVLNGGSAYLGIATEL